MDDMYEKLVRCLREHYPQLRFYDYARVELYHASGRNNLRPVDDVWSCRNFHHSELGYGFYCFPTYKQAEKHRYFYIHHYLFYLEKFCKDGGYVRVRGNDGILECYPAPRPHCERGILFEQGYGYVTRDFGQVLLRDGAVNYLVHC